MNVKYTLYPWVFNRGLWAETIRNWSKEFTVSDMAEILEVSTGAIYGWMKMDSNPNYPWPAMDNFMNVVNELALNPSDFFVIEE